MERFGGAEGKGERPVAEVFGQGEIEIYEGIQQNHVDICHHRNATFESGRRNLWHQWPPADPNAKAPVPLELGDFGGTIYVGMLAINQNMSDQLLCGLL